MAGRAALGKHLVAELWVRDPRTLDDAAGLEQALLAAAERGRFTVLDRKIHAFSPHGVTGILLLSESHLAIHTWPEYGYAAVDVFSCSGAPWEALEELKERLDVEHIEVRELDRGLLRSVGAGSLRLARHR
ncbi:MAG: S-adenosylmethionine decarboxylase proenzyme [Porticoccaceae bacterium]|nr:MAG: S-adenosylmethionine decarboxylase proenzyme [Porticoccaceae bacterium]